MKKILLTVAALGMSLPLMAEGYQINTLSARQGGMAHTGVALKLGAESMYFNPAGLAFMDKTCDLTGSVNGVSATAKCKIGDTWYTTDNKVATPIMFNAAFRVYDNFKAGVSFYTPYGSGINWGENWPAAILNQKVSLKTYTIQPTLSWKVTDKFSIGAGLTMAWGTVDLNKGLVNPASLDIILKMQGIDYSFGNTMPASANLKGTSEYGWGFNVGAMYDVTEDLTVGVSYRSKMTMKVKSGDATVAYANEIATSALQSTLDLINSANFKAEMPMPSVLTFGLGYKPTDRLTLAAEAQLSGWSAYKTLDIVFLDDKVSAFDQHITKDYKNSWAFRIGAQYAMTERLDLRAGCILDLSPVNKDYYNPETPGMTKIEPSVGFSFRPIEGFSIDLSLLYVAGLGANDTKCPYNDMLAAKINALNPAANLPVTPTITADYKVHAVVPSIGISYSF